MRVEGLCFLIGINIVVGGNHLLSDKNAKPYHSRDSMQNFDILWGAKWDHHESENHTLNAI